MGGYGLNMTDHVSLFVDFECLECHGTGNRVTTIGVAHAECTMLAALLLEYIVDFLRDHHS